MKQTVEEAALECRISIAQSMGAYNQYHSIDECFNHGISCDELVENSFIKGAEWQSKQSPWISVKERLPEYNKKVIVLRGDECFISLMYNFGSDCWAIGDDQSNDLIVNEKDFWLPIPSFDEILEANKDVLQRMKEKGD